MEDLLIGRVVASKFAIESLIGSGAMGAVYRARHIALDKPVAVKVLHQAMAKDATFAARLRREAKAASRLDHPNSVRVIDFGEEPDGLLYIAMELLEGHDLFETLGRDWPLPEARIVDLLSQTLSALAVAHDMGIVHRDLKPENIMLSSRTDDDGHPHDHVKVCDFGIAKTVDASDPQGPGGRALTTYGMIIGTPEYMSPEQCRGEPLDARSDLYSVGVILYQLLTGRVPFQGTSAIDIVLKHISDEPTPPSKIRPGISPRLEESCLRALRKQRTDRYPNARAMRADLRAAGAGFESVPEISPRPPAAPLIAGNAETLPSFTAAKPLTEGATPPAGERSRPTTTASGNLVSPRPRRSPRYATAVAILLGVATSAAIGLRRGPALPKSPPLSVSVLPNATPPEAVVSAPTTADEVPARSLPEPPSLRPPPAARPRVHGQAASAAIAEPATPLAPGEPEPRATPLPAANLPPTPPPPERTSTNAASPPPPAPPARADPSKGRVLWNVSAAGGGATSGNVARALGHAATAWQRCYQAALGARPANVEGSATIRLTCDDQGRVVGVTFSGVDMPDLAACIRASSTGTTIPNADTGQAWASIALTFKVPD